jgi:molybdate transport system permease protein
VFNRPASPQVARLLGIPNLSPGTVAEPGAITIGALRISAPTGDHAPGSDILWTIRPDHVAITDRDGYPCTVEDVADIGTMTTLTVRLASGPGAPELRIRTTAQVTLEPGDPCLVRLDPDDITLWAAAPARSGQLTLSAAED